jgi:hypothetical protein
VINADCSLDGDTIASAVVFGLPIASLRLPFAS